MSRRPGPSKRQLRVGELIRQVLAEMLQRGEIHHKALNDVPITVSEVRMTPDLQQATAFVLPLGGDENGDVIAGLSECASFIRGQVGHRVSLRYAPKFRFRLDNTFDESERIEAVLQAAKKRRLKYGDGDYEEPDATGDGDDAGDAAGDGGSAKSDTSPTDNGPSREDGDGA